MDTYNNDRCPCTSMLLAFYRNRGFVKAVINPRISTSVLPAAQR